MSCKECTRRKAVCTREIPQCSVCVKYRRHCLYEQYCRSPLTRKHLTEVEVKLSVAKELLQEKYPGIDVDALLANPSLALREELVTAKTPLHVVSTVVHESISHELQVSQLIPPAVRIPSVTAKDDVTCEYQLFPADWDERMDAPQSVDGMATAGQNGYLGTTSSAELMKEAGLGVTVQNLTPFSYKEHSEISKERLEHFIKRYFETYHISYPIVHQPLFMAQFHEVVAPPREGWKSLVHIVAAIGAFMSATSADDDVDLELYSIARQGLSLETLEVGTLCIVQTLTLMSNYLQKRDRPNSAYNYLGLAVRMALGLGLHKDIGPHESLLTRETRRRVWWCLYIFDCGQTITYGRPLGIPCAGIDARLPLNVADADLTAFTDAKAPPPEADYPTCYTSLRLQAQFHMFTNGIYERIISDPYPSAEQLLEWDQQYIERWKNGIPAFFNEEVSVPPKFRLAQSVLEWRYRNMRIVMYRWYLLRGVPSPIAEDVCLRECSATIKSMKRFWSNQTPHTRMEAWYTLYFLIPAVVMPLIEVRKNPSSPFSSDITSAREVITDLLHLSPFAKKILDVIGSSEEHDDLIFAASPLDEFLKSMLWPASFDI